jgi:hypothetical protein
MLVAEAMPAFSAFARNPGAMLVALRQLIQRQPMSAGLLTMGARVLTSLEPIEAGWEFADQLASDPSGDYADEMAREEAGGIELIESIASGPDGFLCPPGSASWIAEGRAAGRTIVVLTPLGTRLPRLLWQGWLERNGEPSDVRPFNDLIPRDDVEEIIGPDGVQPVAAWCPDSADVAELASF